MVSLDSIFSKAFIAFPLAVSAELKALMTFVTMIIVGTIMITTLITISHLLTFILNFPETSLNLKYKTEKKRILVIDFFTNNKH